MDGHSIRAKKKGCVFQQDLGCWKTTEILKKN